MSRPATGSSLLRSLSAALAQYLMCLSIMVRNKNYLPSFELLQCFRYIIYLNALQCCLLRTLTITLYPQSLCKGSFGSYGLGISFLDNADTVVSYRSDAAVTSYLLICLPFVIIWPNTSYAVCLAIQK